MNISDLAVIVVTTKDGKPHMVAEIEQPRTAYIMFVRVDLTSPTSLERTSVRIGLRLAENTVSSSVYDFGRLTNQFENRVNEKVVELLCSKYRPMSGEDPTHYVDFTMEKAYDGVSDLLYLDDVRFDRRIGHYKPMLRLSLGAHGLVQRASSPDTVRVLLERGLFTAFDRHDTSPLRAVMSDGTVVALKMVPANRAVLDATGWTISARQQRGQIDLPEIYYSCSSNSDESINATHDGVEATCKNVAHYLPEIVDAIRHGRVQRYRKVTQVRRLLHLFRKPPEEWGWV